jgi:hypothetical protein
VRPDQGIGASEISADAGSGLAADLARHMPSLSAAPIRASTSIDIDFGDRVDALLGIEADGPTLDVAQMKDALAELIESVREALHTDGRDGTQNASDVFVDDDFAPWVEQALEKAGGILERRRARAAHTTPFVQAVTPDGAVAVDRGSLDETGLIDDEQQAWPHEGQTGSRASIPFVSSDLNCTITKLDELNALALELKDALTPGRFTFENNDYTGHDFIPVGRDQDHDYGVEASRLLHGFPVFCPVEDDSDDDFGEGAVDEIDFYPRFFTSLHESWPFVGRQKRRFLLGVMLHELVHAVDGTDGDAFEPIEWRGKWASQGDSDNGSEYRAAYVQARYYRLDRCTSRIWAETYLHSDAGHFSQFSGELSYFLKNWMSRCLAGFIAAALSVELILAVVLAASTASVALIAAVGEDLFILLVILARGFRF